MSILCLKSQLILPFFTLSIAPEINFLSIYGVDNLGVKPIRIVWVSHTLFPPKLLFSPPIEFKLSKTKQIWRYFLKEVDNLIDIFQVVVFDYYARFNMGVAKCLFVNIPSFLWNCVRKLRNRGFGKI